MVRIGYTMMTEQAGPRELVGHVVGAERAGFDFSVTSDHYFPWLAEQGRPYVDAGFTEVALVQIGGDRQEPFLEWAEAELLPALRELT
ncbi:hypothetical protein GTY73_08430 [Streptomyces sp. SID8354]|nr:hypothetical protein [Streptomyces sp. SID8354]